MQLAAHVADLAPGGKRALTAIELGADPVAIVTTRYVVERTTDPERTYTVAATRQGTTTASRLVVDPAGGVVEDTVDDTVIRRQ
jgi:hypothetical protein